MSNFGFYSSFSRSDTVQTLRLSIRIEVGNLLRCLKIQNPKCITINELSVEGQVRRIKSHVKLKPTALSTVQQRKMKKV